ncbi:scavenger receptor class F member 1 isoform X2 [Strix aluco]|uniref:scavenger receptor class F member 1 isoform X2 n=1 Tax=Strix aluco TaxID=111821 RepID=UPI003DA5DC8C
MPVSAARVAARAKTSLCGGIPCLPLPTAPLTSESGRLLPRFLRKKPKAGGRKRPHCGRDGTDGRRRRRAGEPLRLGPLRPAGMGSARPILCLQLWLWVQSSAQELDSNGRNVCRLPTGPECCPGWKQEGRECTAALCEGEDACGVDEVCVKPGVCLCKPGFFGADCSSPVGAASAASPAHPWTASAWPASPAGMGPSARNPAHPASTARAASSHVPAAGVGRPVTQRPGPVCTVIPAGWDPAATAPALWAPSEMDASSSAQSVFRGAATPCRELASARRATGEPGNTRSRAGPGPRSPREHFPPFFLSSSCNDTCLEGYFGVNCSSPCQCSRGTCHPVRGDCVLSFKDHGALAAAILVPLLLLLLCVACCCCGAGPADARDRAAVPDDDVLARMKHHVRGVLANLSAMMPCFSLGGYKLPKVTVSHHDTEIPFNPSFIEPPSAAWVSDSSFSSSFETDNEGPEYSVPPREGIPLLGGAELQDGASPPAEALLDPSAFDSEDVSQPFAIPRTSSIAKAKRPSVSFAEGTKFGAAETPSPGRKPKTPWVPSKLSSAPGDTAAEPPTERPASDCYESPEPLSKGEESHRPSPRATPGGRRRVVSSTRHVAQRVEALEAAAKSGSWEAKGKETNVTTIYMMVGTAGQDPKAEGGGEGPVQAVLKRLGSLQKGKWAAKEEPKVRRSVEAIQKPPRRALAQCRDSVNSCKQRESVPGAPAEPSPGKHLPGKRLSFLLASPSPKSTEAQDGASDAAGATERGKSPELVLSLEMKGQATPEEEPQYENVISSSADSPPSPAKELPAAPAAT